MRISTRKFLTRFLSLVGRKAQTRVRRERSIGAGLMMLEDRLCLTTVVPAVVPPTYHVNTLADVVDASDNKLSLREAVSLANDHPGAKIILDLPGTYKLTRADDDGDTDLDITANVTIVRLTTTTLLGPVVPVKLPLSKLPLSIFAGGIAVIDGNHTGRIFDIHDGANVTLDTLTLQNGLVDDDGGAIAVEDTGSTLSLHGVTIKNNSSSGMGGGIFATSGSVVKIDGSNFINNLSGGSGAGVADLGPSLKVTNSSFARNNSGDSGGGIFFRNDTTESGSSTGSLSSPQAHAASVLDETPTSSSVTITNTTFDTNKATRFGGGVYAASAPVSSQEDDVNDPPAGTSNTVTTLEDTTFTFTAADFGFTDPNDTPPNVLLAVKITTLPAVGSLTDNGVAVTAGQSVPIADITGGLLKFTPAANTNGAGSAAFTFQVQDNGGTSGGGVDLDPTPKTMTINVASVNDTPDGTSSTISMIQDTSHTFTVADFGFTDPNDTPPNVLLAVDITTLPAIGSLTDNGIQVTAGQFIPVADITGGLLKFTPAPGSTGFPYASFTFQVQDDGGTANGGVDTDPTPKTLTIDVSAVNTDAAQPRQHESPSSKITVNGSAFIGKTVPSAVSSTTAASPLQASTPPKSTVTVSSSTFTGDLAGNNGGGVYVQEQQGNLVTTKLTITDSTFSNSVGNSGGGVFAQSVNNISIHGSTFTRDRATQFGGGLGVDEGNVANHLKNVSIGGSTFSNDVAKSGGGIYVKHAASIGIDQSTISGDRANADGGGLYLLFANAVNPDVNTATSAVANITASTFNNNAAAGNGGGMFIQGTGGTTTLLNDTIASNTAVLDGGGLYADSGTVQLTFDTIAKNSAGSGGGVFNNEATIHVIDAIIALNLASGSADNGPDVFGDFDDQGFNLIGISDGSTGFTDSALVGTAGSPINPKLGKLANNGGPTQTMALLKGSAAINAGSSSPGVGTDQRGFTRGTPPDIGAFDTDSNSSETMRASKAS